MQQKLAAVTQVFTHNLSAEPSAKSRTGNTKQQQRSWAQATVMVKGQLREIRVMVLLGRM